jgi:hypothetical protein
MGQMFSKEECISIILVMDVYQKLSLRRSVQVEIVTEPDMAGCAQLNVITVHSLPVSSGKGGAF